MQSEVLLASKSRSRTRPQAAVCADPRRTAVECNYVSRQPSLRTVTCLPAANVSKDSQLHVYHELGCPRREAHPVRGLCPVAR